ncbi:glycoside hydrolase/deacetylase [Ascobolus immersus RN42]|uniref:Glycoside hydrolase/deacetylase n=1 Tax=Ascobolus immersus RN42 TaxID=1160509 RepID=A0A3N4ID40_ASCIM|nr:glycoside hydrolase/deacetylase [Ascobolus immersus RN42]
MLFSKFATLLPFVLAVAASPTGLVKRVVSPDGTCGPANGYTCETGECCSQYGWCGVTTDHCGAGCQSAFGKCNGSTPPPPTTTTTTKPTSTPTPTPTPTPPPSSGGRPKPGSLPYGVPIATCKIPGVIALTFDDGPYIYTNALLNMLKAKKAKATFFVNGLNWGPDIMVYDNRNRINRMRYEGHQIGSHTYNHADLSTLSYAGVQAEMTALEAPLTSILGKFPTYMRPPYLNCANNCPAALNDLGYHIIQTDLDTQDWQGDAEMSKQIFKQMVDARSLSEPGYVVLAHDVHEATVHQLAEYMVDYAQSKGLRLVTVGECMGDPSANWYRTA